MQQRIVNNNNNAFFLCTLQNIQTNKGTERLIRNTKIDFVASFHPEHQSFSHTEKKSSFLDPQRREEDKTLPDWTGTARFNGACASRGQRSVVSPVSSLPVSPSEAFSRPVTSDLSSPTASSQSPPPPAIPPTSCKGACVCFTCLLSFCRGREWRFFCEPPERLCFVRRAAGRQQTSV